MKAKTYRAKDIQQALDRIKAELGPDAMILSTQKLERRRAFGLLRPNGWEVTAAAKEPQKSAAPAPEPKRTQTAAPARAEKEPELFVPQANPRAKAPAAPRVVPGAPVLPHIEQSDARFEKLLQEVNGLKKTLQQISRTIPAVSEDRNGTKAELLALGIDPAAVDAIVARADEGHPDEDELRRRIRAALEELFLVETPVELLGRARTISVFVGPAGVGKTTALAKLAGHARAIYKKRVTMISMDRSRIGGAEQLAEYGSLMEIPVYICPDVAALQKLVDNIEDDLVLIDTPGVSPTDKAGIDEVRAITSLPNMRVHIVVGAATRPEEIDAIVSSFAGNGPRRILITKRDEVQTHSVLLAHALRNELPISYIAHGPHVPEDLSVPGAEELAGALLPVPPIETVEVA